MLHYAVRRHLHETVFAAGLHHAGQQSIQCNRIGRGVVGRNHRILDTVFDRRKQPRTMSHVPEQFVQQRHGRGLAVSTGYANQFQAGRGVVVKVRCHGSHRSRTLRHNDVTYRRIELLGQPFTHNRARSGPDRRTYIVMPVATRAHDGKEHRPAAHAARIERQRLHHIRTVADHALNRNARQD